MMNNVIYQKIFNELYNFLPHNWENLIVYLEHGEASYSYSFYTKYNGEYKKCYDLENVDEKELFQAFENIEQIVSNERNKSDELWSNFTMTIDREGNMKSYFDYTDLSNGSYEYKKMWKLKYINE